MINTLEQAMDIILYKTSLCEEINDLIEENLFSDEAIAEIINAFSRSLSEESWVIIAIRNDVSKELREKHKLVFRQDVYDMVRRKKSDKQKIKEMDRFARRGKGVEFKDNCIYAFARMIYDFDETIIKNGNYYRMKKDYNVQEFGLSVSTEKLTNYLGIVWKVKVKMEDWGENAGAKTNTIKVFGYEVIEELDAK